MGLVFLAAYAVFLARWARGIAGGSDNSGYLNIARLWRAGTLREPLRPPAQGFATAGSNPWTFTPLGFRPHEGASELVPIYPPGLPALQVAVSFVAPTLEHASKWVNVACGVLFAVACYRLARRFGLPRPWAWATTALLAANPLSLYFFTWNMSDGPAATLCALAMVLALEARKASWWAFGAGFSFSLAVAVRPTDVLLFPALALALPATARTWLAFATGALPLSAALAWYDSFQFGAPWRTGYGSVASEFKVRYFLPTFGHYALWFSRMFSPMVVPAWILACLRAFRRRDQLLLAAWALPFLLFYGFYKYTNDAWWYLRFILPALPAVVLSAAMSLRELLEQRVPKPQVRRIFAGAAVSTALAFALHWDRQLAPHRIAAGDESYKHGIALLEAVVSPGDVLMAMQCSGAVYFYTNHGIARYDLMGELDLQRFLEKAEKEGRRVYMLLWRSETFDFPKRYPFLVEKIAEKGQASLWQVFTEKRFLIGVEKPQPTFSGKTSVQ